MPVVVGGPGAPATGLVLTRLWLNPVDDPADVMSLRVSSFSPGRSVSGEVRELANGRLRLVRQAARPRTIDADVRRPTPAQRRWLDEHVGVSMTVRDPDGGKFVGVYLDVGYDRPVEGADMSLTWQRVTRSEAV